MKTTTTINSGVDPQVVARQVARAADIGARGMAS